jgi:DNA invertase Pin-like site-specific DNA recombinase
MGETQMASACAYYRTSSATNVGEDKDSLKRQQAAVRQCAKARGLEIVNEYYDAAVSGGDPVDTRDGFKQMLAYMSSNGARTIVVENASRFARDLIVQETGYQMLKARGIELIAADSPDSFLSDTPTAVLIRQILGAVAQFDRASLVTKLRGARERIRRQQGRCEGRKPEIPQHVADEAAKASATGLSLRSVSTYLASKGMVTATGKAYSASQVQQLLKRA